MMGPLLVVVVVAVIAAIIAVSRVTQRQRAENKQLSAQRGWNVEYANTEDGLESTYSGTTNGIGWRFIMRAGAGNARWETSAPLLSNDVIGVFPSLGKKDVTVPNSAPKFLVALAARTMTLALGTDGIDADLFANAKPVVASGKGLDAYLLRSTNAELMSRFLDAGATDILRREAQRPNPGKHNIMIFAAGHMGTRLLMMGQDYSLDRIDEIVRMGIGLGAAVTRAQRV